MDPQKLLGTALQVLVSRPRTAAQPADVNKLRLAFPFFASLPPHELACEVLNTLAGWKVPQSVREQCRKRS